MPDELVMWIVSQDDATLIKLLNWTKSNTLEDIGQELHNTISRQAPVKDGNYTGNHKAPK